MSIPNPHTAPEVGRTFLIVLALGLGTSTTWSAPRALAGASSHSNAAPGLANYRHQRASRSLQGARRYMDRRDTREAQNLLEEDDDQRGSLRLA